MAELSTVLELVDLKSEWDYLCEIVDPSPTGWTPGWEPQPKQKLAAELFEQAKLTLYGGAVGGGKSALLCQVAVREMRMYPNNRGVILRRSFPALNRTIVPTLKELLLPHLATWHKKYSLFEFPNSSILECKSSQYPDDILEFLGAELGFVGFEELTEFAKSQFVFMTQRMRSKAPGIRPKMMCTTNPVGPGRKWVKETFIRPEPEDIDPESPNQPAPYKIWWPKRNYVPTPEEIAADGGEQPRQARVYIPATIHDNQILLKRDREYLGILQDIQDPRMRKSMLDGDWDALDEIEGALWSWEDIDEPRVSPQWFKDNITSWQRVIALDPSLGTTKGDSFGVAICSRGSDSRGYVEGSRELKGPRRKILETCIDLYHDHGCSEMVVEINHGGPWLVEAILAIDPTINVVMERAADGKRPRAEPVSVLFQKSRSSGLRQVVMCGLHPELEKELTETTFEFGKGETSPNRLDAMVWALHRLMLPKTRELRDRSDDINDGRDDGRR